MKLLQCNMQLCWNIKACIHSQPAYQPICLIKFSENSTVTILTM